MKIILSKADISQIRMMWIDRFSRKVKEMPETFIIEAVEGNELTITLKIDVNLPWSKYGDDKPNTSL